MVRKDAGCAGGGACTGLTSTGARLAEPVGIPVFVGGTGGDRNGIGLTNSEVVHEVSWSASTDLVDGVVNGVQGADTASSTDEEFPWSADQGAEKGSWRLSVTGFTLAGSIYNNFVQRTNVAESSSVS